MKQINETVDLKPDQLFLVKSILNRYVPNRAVLAFGSRATWTAKEYSDLDLAILGQEPLSGRITASLREEFVESALPFKVDVVEWARVDDEFRAIILRDGVELNVSDAV